MTDTDITATDSTSGAQQQNLNALRLPELRQIAQRMGIRGTSTLRKGALIEAIQSNGASLAKPARETASEAAEAVEAAGTTEPTKAPTRRRATKRVAAVSDDAASSSSASDAAAAVDEASTNVPAESSNTGDGEEVRYESRSAARRARRNRARMNQREQRDKERGQQRNASGARDSRDTDDAAPAADTSADSAGNTANTSDDNARQDGNRDNQQDRRQQRNYRDDDGDDRRGRRNNRRERPRRGRDNRNDDEVREDDVLQNVAGILDIVDNNVAFLRTSGYQSGPADVFVTQQMIRRLGLRRGDAIIGQVKAPREGQNNYQGGRNRQKYNPLVRVDTINGMTVEEARQRPEFSKLTPLYPNQRLRLETDPKILTTRVIDLIMPIGKGQRALIVSPPKAGKTTILQNVANAIAKNNPECYLMVVLVDERPEEVTDMQRSVHGEVIASTFDRPPSEHTTVAELAIERAKRLVEQGQDVVVLLDSITRLGRAYNNSSPASGRILSGGVDSNALYPPKRFLGAARNIENGGSLTIIATAMVETGSAGDTVIFEEFKGTGNAELKLDRRISERRVFPAVDVNPSGTRKDELLLAPEEARIMHKLRRILSNLDNQQAIDLLIKQLKKTKSNGEFLMQIASSAPMAGDVEEDFS